MILGRGLVRGERLDFNTGRYPWERRNCVRMSFLIRRFGEIIEDLNLNDLLLNSGPFTLCGGMNN